MKLRLVTKQDESLLLQWRNDPLVRAVSVSSEPISAREHHIWFSKLLSSESTFCFIGVSESCVGNDAVGYCRFESKSAHLYEISIAIDPARQGKGHGAELLHHSCRALVGIVDGRLVVSAKIKTDNWRSRHIFRAAGFVAFSIGKDFVRLEKVLRQ